MKNDRLPPLNSLRAFDAASRHLSFQKAADELSVTPSALSFQIRQLEEHLQIALFTRLNRQVVLTDAGERFAPMVQDAFARMRAAMLQLNPPEDDNILTVSTGPAFAAKWLSPRIYRFLEQHPEIDIRIAATLSLVDFFSEPIDVGIRFGGGQYPGLHVEPLANEAATALVSSRLMDRYGGSISMDQLADIPLLHDDSAAFLPTAVNWAMWLDKAGIDDVDEKSGQRFHQADHALDAAVDCAGILLGRLTLAARDIISGRLVAPFDLVLPSRAAFYFVCLRDSLEVPKVAKFRAFLLEEIARDRAAMADLVALPAEL